MQRLLRDTTIDLGQFRMALHQFKHIPPGKVAAPFQALAYLAQQFQILNRIKRPTIITVIG